MAEKLIEVLGIGCQRCIKTAEEIELVAKSLDMKKDIDYCLVKITDPKMIAMRGVMATPGVIIDGRLVCAGRIPNREEIGKWLK